MKQIILFVFISFIFSSCSYVKNVQLLVGGKTKAKNYVHAISFEMRKDIIVVKARVNDDEELYEFIFDSGAFNSKIEYNLANKLDIQVVTSKTNSTAQGIERKIEVVSIDSIQLGDITFYNIGAGKLVYDETSASPCIAKNGIIGANLMKLAHWKIDFKQQVLFFSDKPFEVEDEAFTLAFKRPLLSGTPEISIEIESVKIDNVLFDLGYNGGLVLPLAYADYFKNQESKIILDQSTSGIYGTNYDSIIVKKLNVNIGGYLKVIPVEFSARNKMLLGNEFLKYFTVLLDYDKNEIKLVNESDVEISTRREFLAGILNDSLWIVTRTTPKITLQLNDTLLFVNGKLNIRNVS